MARALVSNEFAFSVYALLEDCSLWLRQNGIAQWESPYPRQRFDREVESGAVWCWRSKHGVDATVTLLTERPDYYPNQIWRNNTCAWYICRFAVARRLKGTGLGPRLLAEICADASAARIGALRLDVLASNPFLARYYETKGFNRVAEADIKGEGSVFLEKLSPPTEGAQ